MNKKLNVGIVGAGIQGISNALFLQKKGYEVKIFEKRSFVFKKEGVLTSIRFSFFMILVKSFFICAIAFS